MFEQNMSIAGYLEDNFDEGLLSSLIEVLKKECSVYVELKQFLMEENHLLNSSPSVAKINDNNILKENIILKSRILEEVRVNILRKIARQLDTDEGKIKLEDVMKYVKNEKTNIIEQLKKELMTVAMDITLLNNNNHYILDIYNNNLNSSLEILSSLVDKSAIYLNTGKLNDFSENGRLLRTEG